MKLRFLCAAHRTQLSLNPEQAIRVWQNGFDTGQLLYDQGQRSEAVPQLGCAFETAEILMSAGNLHPKQACSAFINSAFLLINTLVELGHVEDSNEVCLMTISRLEAELSYNSNALDWIDEPLKELYFRVQHTKKDRYLQGDVVSNNNAYSLRAIH